MNALISGRAGRALMLDGDSLRSFDVDDPSQLVPRAPSDFAYLFGEMEDLCVLENTDVESVQLKLKHESDSALALELALISLDAELPDDIRKEAMEGLDELLVEARVAERLENVLYARPLPDDADLATALELCGDASLSSVLNLLRRLEEREPFIREVCEAWDSIPTKVFGDYDQQAEFLQRAVREGLFRTLVITRESRNTTSTFLLNAGLNNSVKQLRNHRPVLQQWTTSFRQSAGASDIKNQIEEEVEAEVSPRRRHGRRFGIDRPAMLREVNRRKGIIIEALHRHDLGLITQLIDELVDYQRTAEPVHVAKSLCDLAMEAKSLGLFSLQLKLTNRSVNIASGDAWSWAQYGDALLNMHRLDDALTAYHQARGFGAGAIAGTGKAEVLKAQGDLPAALAAFDEVIRAHPENVVAKNGRAEVLKAQGDLPAALAAFDDVIRVHPEDVVARSGRAEVLKAQGDLPAALAAFDEVISAHPENVVAKTGRAEVLKAQGDLPAALAAFDDVISAHPENVVAKSGRSCVLAVLERYDEALADLPRETPRNLRDWIGFHIRGMILLRMGRLEEAVKIFKQGVVDDPLPLGRQYFHTALSVALMRLGEYGSAKKILSSVEAEELQPQVNILLVHCYGEEDQTVEARAAFESISAQAWSISNELIEELNRRYILKQPPHHSDEWVFDQEIGSMLVVASQQAPFSNYLS
ncbi:MAG TPA: tetratricopeptide repeat protein [Pyrinomonadaceae bacterium]|nr:tetratricopeptide repeat protein [Pyrinomonadaceae bacterium]